MAHIVPSLNLNRSPQQVQPYSLVFAKNVKLDETGSSIVRDDNLTYSDITSYCKSKYGVDATIVGCITTPREILAFINRPGNTIRIIRYNEDHRILNQIVTSLTYNGGEFIGTYNYNVRNELIIIFSEKNANKDIPLRTINVGEFVDYDDDDFEIDKSVEDISQYNLVNDVPFAKCKMSLRNGINIPSGTYNFFIRYKIDKVYTNWFPVGKTYFAARVENTVVYNVTRYNKVSAGFNEDHYKSQSLSINLANINTDCDYGFNLSLNFNNIKNYITEFQLGYILRHDNNFVGRIFGNFYIENNSCNILFNAKYIDEEPVNNFTKENFNIYNVGNIVNYNNRVYISNYKENNNNVNFDVSHILLRWKTDTYHTNKNAINNNATLKPNEVYNFFIHFVREDGSYTNGIRLSNDNNNIFSINNKQIDLNQKADDYYDDVKDYVDTTDYSLSNINLYKLLNNARDGKFGYYINSKEDKLFKAPDIKEDLIKLEIICNEQDIPEGFVGYFISYEKIESVFLYEGFLRTTDDKDYRPDTLFKSYDVELSNISYKGNIIRQKNDGKWYGITDSKLWASNVFKKTLGTHGGIEISTNPNLPKPEQNRCSVYQIVCTDKDIYANENKILYRLTNVFTKEDLKNNQNDNMSDFNYPSFFNNNVFYIYSARVVVNPEGKLFDFIQLPHFNILDYDEHVAIFDVYNSAYMYNDINVNCLSFKQKPSIAVAFSTSTTYSDPTKKSVCTYIEPSILSDAFEIQSDFLLSAGINNLINYSAYNKDYPVLEQFDNTIRRSDVFANESVENSWRNFGGENYKVISNTRGKIKKLIPLGKYFLIHLEQGLFVFDRDNKMKLQDKEIQLTTPDTFDLEAQEVYTSENGFLGLQDEDSTMINSYGYTFYENDTKTIYNYDAGKLNILSLPIQRVLENYDITKVSMAFDNNNSRLLMCFFISGGRTFTISYNYLSKTFVSLHDFKFNKSWSTKTISYLKTCDNTNLLVFTKQLYEDNYREANIINRDTEELFKEFKDVSEHIFPVIADVYPNKVNNYSIVDIIFNEGYDVPKVLNTIKYILSEFKDDIENVYQAEDELKLEYPGDFIMVYSDRCATDYQDLINPSNDFNYGNYKKPWNDKGIWNYNYFRNIKNIIFDDSDEKSLIYGKYFVIRFVFKPNTKFKLENLTCDINRY